MEDLTQLFVVVDNLFSTPFIIYGFTLTFKGLFFFSCIVSILGSIVARLFFDND